MRLIVHIGLPKTGSTYLEAFLVEDRELFREQKLLYPYDWRENKLINHQSFLAAIDSSDSESLQDIVGKSLSAAEGSNCNKILISHAYLSTLSNPK